MIEKMINKGMRKLTTKEFIEKAKKVHGNLYDYVEVVYVNAHTKICIIGPKYGKFWQSPDDHLRGHGFSVSNTKTFIQKAQIIHDNLYDYSKVDYQGSKIKICIIDPIYGEFWQSADSHLQGHDNPNRALLNRSDKRRMSLDKFIQKAQIIHGNLYDYSKVDYRGSKIKICIIDPEYGEFYISPSKHLGGGGNQKRALLAKAKARFLTTKEFIIKAKQIHGNLYDYSKVDYRGSKIKVCIIDPMYGEFWQEPGSHLRGVGNPDRSTNGKLAAHKDHIIPLAIIGSRNKINKERPLYKFLNSQINIQEISGNENNKKSDWIEYKGEQIRARDHRNDYAIIAYLSETLLNENIDHIIKKDKYYYED